MAHNKGWIDRLSAGRNKKPEAAFEKLSATRWTVFKNAFSMRMMALVKANLLAFMFFLPAVLWLGAVNLLFKVDILNKWALDANLGGGYPSAEGALLGYSTEIMQKSLLYDLALIPLLMIGFVGLVGALNAVRHLIWTDQKAVVKNFFRGVKANFVPALITGFFAGAAILLLEYTINTFNLTEPRWYTVIGIILAAIVLVFVILMTMFMLTQATAYKMKFWHLVKNSLIFSGVKFPHTFFFAAISLLPFLILFLFPGMMTNFIGSMILILILFVAFSYAALIWTLYGHWVFESSLGLKPENVEISGKSGDEGKADPGKRVQSGGYVNPKKGKSGGQTDSNPGGKKA